MSVEIFDNMWGPAVICTWCNHNLILNSKTDYAKCENCGGKYDDPNKEALIIKPYYNWFYIKWLIKSWL